VRLTVCLLVVLLVGGGVWWRLQWARWCQVLAAEQTARSRERFVAEQERRLVLGLASRLRGVLERHRDGLEAEQMALDVELWELTWEEDGVE